MPAAQTTYIRWRGKYACICMVEAFADLEKRSGRLGNPFQGGYNGGGVAASAGTHDDGGVADWSTFSAARTKAARAMGICSNNRHTWQRFSSNHNHAFIVGCPHMSSGLRFQQSEYYAGRNGLAGRGRDTEWRPSTINTYRTWQSHQGVPMKPSKKPSKKTLMISGRWYEPISTVGARWVNREVTKYRRGTRRQLTREVFYVQTWLRKLGYYKSTLDGLWGKVSQAAYDLFRWNNRAALGIHNKAGASGTAGTASLTLLRNRAGSKMGISK